jgi:N-acetylmuramic acid 6-phosphate etherase
MKKRKPGKQDVVIGIASSGRTPFTVAAVAEARRRGAKTIALTCNRKSPLERAAHISIVTDVGPEVLAGSSRMKAGTAHKMVLNMISTGAMTRLGYVYGNLMVNVVPKNEKLTQRAIGILERATGAEPATARHTLEAAGNRTPVALVMLAALRKTNGHVRQASLRPKASDRVVMVFRKTTRALLGLDGPRRPSPHTLSQAVRWTCAAVALPRPLGRALSITHA